MSNRHLVMAWLQLNLLPLPQSIKHDIQRRVCCNRITCQHGHHLRSFVLFTSSTQCSLPELPIQSAFNGPFLTLYSSTYVCHAYTSDKFICPCYSVSGFYNNSCANCLPSDLILTLSEDIWIQILFLLMTFAHSLRFLYTLHWVLPAKIFSQFTTR